MSYTYGRRECPISEAVSMSMEGFAIDAQEIEVDYIPMYMEVTLSVF